MGAGVPQRDREEDAERHAVAMLALFSPRPRDAAAPLGEDAEGAWAPRYRAYLRTAPSAVLKLIDNMQVMHECRDAKDDWSGKRRARMADLTSRARAERLTLKEDDDLTGHLDILQHTSALEAADVDPDVPVERKDVRER